MKPKRGMWLPSPKFSTPLQHCSPLKVYHVGSETCIDSLGHLFHLLDGVVHHPLSGTELGFVRAESDVHDSDIDIFVDVPPFELLLMLSTLRPIRFMFIFGPIGDIP